MNEWLLWRETESPTGPQPEISDSRIYLAFIWVLSVNLHFQFGFTRCCYDADVYPTVHGLLGQKSGDGTKEQICYLNVL